MTTAIRNRWIVGSLLLALLPACTTTITPPVDPVDPVSVFLVDFGRHASLLLPDPDPDPDDPAYVEYNYGDWNWFALDRTEWHDVFGTVFVPTQAALGRRRLDIEPDAEAIERTLHCEYILTITVARESATALVTDLDASFEAAADKQHYQPLYDLTFVPVERPYHLCHACNQVLVAWLEDLGCAVSSPAMAGEFVIREP